MERIDKNKEEHRETVVDTKGRKIGIRIRHATMIPEWADAPKSLRNKKKR